MSQSTWWNLQFGNIGFLSDDLLHLHSAKYFVDDGFVPNTVCTWMGPIIILRVIRIEFVRDLVFEMRCTSMPWKGVPRSKTQ